MNLQKDLDEIKNEVREEIKNETSETMSPAPLVEQPLNSNSFEDAKNQALAEFKPKYDTNKTMYENGKDIEVKFTKTDDRTFAGMISASSGSESKLYIFKASLIVKEFPRDLLIFSPFILIKPQWDQ